MGKLKRDEIEKELSLDGTVTVTDIPYDARSKFTFEIEEDIADLVEQITQKHTPKYAPEERHIDAETGEIFFTGGRHERTDRKDESRRDIDTGKSYWNTSGRDTSFEPWDLKGSEGKYELWDTDFYCYASVTVEKDKMMVETALSGFKYEISQNKEGGSTVEFSGPLNALMRQNLLPKMTYVPGTLEGKFVDDNRDLTPYMPIEDYCLLRAQKNRGRENQQDVFGAHINYMFNNEIPAFEKWVEITDQERKNNKAQREFAEGEKLSEYAVKKKVDLIRNRLAKNKELTSEIRDGMAKTKESGYKHISRTPSLNKGGRED